MNKEQALELLMLLSAMESWAFAHRNALPDYLASDLSGHLDRLKDIVLEKADEQK